MASRQKPKSSMGEKNSGKQKSLFDTSLGQTENRKKPKEEKKNWSANQSSIIEGGSSED